jgi:peptidyl-prolyl cis-trans isomerase A (cyclophilin A)
MRTLVSLLLVTAAVVPGHGVPSQAGKTTRPARTSPSGPALPPVTLPTEAGEYAILYTSEGSIVCRLFPEEAPKTVANFVALAQGAKSWTNPTSGKRMRTPLYSGTIFHRVIPDFMIQGGDPEGTGAGSPGYKFDDEIAPNRHFDKAGILAMANSGPNTNGSQFFITVAPAEHLDGHYSIFGEVVSGQDVADAISKAPRKPAEGGDEPATKDGLSDKPVTPVKLIRVVIKKVGSPAAKTPAPAVK